MAKPISSHLLCEYEECGDEPVGRDRNGMLACSVHFLPALCACGCGEPLPVEPPRRGRPRRFVNDAHKMRAYMRRYRAQKKILQKSSEMG